MTVDQLEGRRLRLRLELAHAFASTVARTGQIDRLADELAQAERQLAALRPIDEQTDDSLLGFAW